MADLDYALEFLNGELDQLGMTLKFAQDHLADKIRCDKESIELAIKLVTNKKEVMK